MATLTSAEQQALLWPIKAKGKVDRLKPLNDPTISQFYQNSMEQGRFLESSIADANNWLLQKKTLLNEYVISYTHMNQLAVDGQLNHHHRVPKYIADSISILQTAHRLQQEIVSLNNAVTQNITKILAIEQSMTNMVQTANNSLANLLNNICNWGIPGLPSIPNLFPDSLWNWNGFMFSPLALFAALKSNTNFNFNFTFKDCSFGPTSTHNLFVTDPLTTETYSGLVYGSANYLPPLSGQITPASQDLTDSTQSGQDFITQMQGTMNQPWYSPDFNPNENMLGATPDPHFIISNFQMPAATYVSDIVSICPQTRGSTVFLTDPDYSNPNLAVRQPVLQKTLAHSINLAQIVASNYDPFVVSEWLIYLNLTRNGRGGVWIPNFQAVYDQFLQPSISDILTLTVPWNDVLPSNASFFWMGTWNSLTSYVVGDVVVFNGVNYVATADNTGLEPDTNPSSWGSVPAGTVYSNAPVIKLITTLQGMTKQQLNHLLWQLSYIEASLLGYTRNSNFDAYQDTAYLAGPTGNSLDYVPTAVTAAQSSLVLGQGTAQFPVPITFPAVMKTTLDAVIAIATIAIQNDANYQSPRLGNRFTFDQFAQATPVDRFSQFWRDFATNLSHFLAQDPYLIQFAVTYPEILDGALDPLASTSNKAAYASLLADVASRSRTWVPGTPLPNIPVQPVTGLTNSSTPNANTNGWVLPPTDLDPVAFLARPDIVVLPIPVQIAMLRTNLSYAGVNKWASQMSTSITDQINVANSILASTQQIGFLTQINCDAITAASSNGVTLTVRTNSSYLPLDNILLEGMAEAGLNGKIVVVITASATQFTAADPLLTAFNNPSDTGTATLVTNAPTAVTTPVNFDTVVFDFTGNVTNRNTFTIQTAGNYIGSGQITFEPTSPVSGPGVYTVTVTQNGTPIYAASSDPTQIAPQTLGISLIVAAAQGDVFQVLASHNFPGTQIVNSCTSFFGMTLSDIAVPQTESTADEGTDATNTFVVSNPLPSWFVGTVLPALTAVAVQTDGTISPVDTLVPAVTNISITSNVVTVTTSAAGHHFKAGDLVVFSGLDPAAFLNGMVVTVGVTRPLTSVANASGGSTVYTGTITGGAANAFAGYTFVISGFTIPANNGTFTCTASTATTLTLSNASGVAETHAATAVGGVSATTFLADFTHADYASTAQTSGSVLYALDASGAVKAPFVDGVTVASAAAGQQVAVANGYGGIYSATGESYPTGSLLYVGQPALQGVLTNNYSTLILTSGWIIVVGRAVSTGSFLFEPHIPMRTTIL